MGIISRLINSGDLLLYHDYRSGSFRDFSGNSKHGTPSGGLTLERGQVNFPQGGDPIINCGSDTLGTGPGTIFAYFNARSGGQSTGRLFDVAGGLTCYFTTASTEGVTYYSGSYISTPGGSVPFGKDNLLVLSWNTDGVANCYVNSALVKGPDDFGTLSAGSAILIGNRNALGRAFDGKYFAVGIINRELTASEVQELEAEVRSKKWNQQTATRVQDGSKDFLADTLSGYSSITDGTYTATDTIPGTNFYVQSGTFTVQSETINGKTSKSIACSSAGVLTIDLANYVRNYTDAAYGEWEWWFYKPDTTNGAIMPIASVAAAYDNGSQDGYLVYPASSERVYYYRVDSGAGTTLMYTAVSTITHSVWQKYKVKRTFGDLYTLYANDSMLTAASGTNPGNDATHRQSKYFVWDANVGEKLGLKTSDGESILHHRPIDKLETTGLGPGALETVSNVTAGPLPGTPFEVNSGTFKTTYDTINGKPVKVIECVGAGLIYAPWSRFQNNETEAAYGTWEFWIKKTDGGVTEVVFCGTQPAGYSDANQDGYYYQHNASEQVRGYEISSGSLTLMAQSASDTVSVASWDKVRITRTSAGVFSYYLNDTLWSAASGTNPDTETTHTSGKYIVFTMDAGDKIAIAAFDGTPLLVKRKGVA